MEKKKIKIYASLITDLLKPALLDTNQTSERLQIPNPLGPARAGTWQNFRLSSLHFNSAT